MLCLDADVCSYSSYNYLYDCFQVTDCYTQTDDTPFDFFDCCQIDYLSSQSKWIDDMIDDR